MERRIASPERAESTGNHSPARPPFLTRREFDALVPAGSHEKTTQPAMTLCEWHSNTTSTSDVIHQSFYRLPFGFGDMVHRRTVLDWPDTLKRFGATQVLQVLAFEDVPQPKNLDGAAPDVVTCGRRGSIREIMNHIGKWMGAAPSSSEMSYVTKTLFIEKLLETNVVITSYL